MADRPDRAASVRVRTTLAAVGVVAVSLLAGGVLLVLLVRGSLHDQLQSRAEDRASALADQVDGTGLPVAPARDDDDLDEPEDEVWQVTDASGRVVRASQPLADPLPTGDDEVDVRPAGAEHDYVVVTEDAGRYTVAVAVSLEEVDDSTSALVPLLAIGLPVLLLLVGGVTWTVATRALAPVERIRREVDRITGDRLELRVPEPGTRDEIHRLALTMNRMLERLESSRDRQRSFVADASHELRSPLATIRQTAEVSRAHPGAIPEAELVDLVHDEALRMQRLVEQLLLLTRADEGAVVTARRDVDLDDLVLAEAPRVRRSGLEVDTAGVGPARVTGDQASLAQVVRNLVDNAVRHAVGRVVLATVQHGDQVELSVADDGPGVPEAERMRVFERFVRLDEARSRDAGGSGLGLAIVAEIVRAHGGSARVDEAPGGGARFVVRLPAQASTGS